VNVSNLMMVALVGWINPQQKDVFDCATAGSGFADCCATTAGMPHKINESNFWTLRESGHSSTAFHLDLGTQGL
jgi:hypothetical protein